MRILLDTNIVVRLSEPATPQAHDVRRAVAQLPEQGFECCLVPQVVYEYWSVATRPAANNGLGLSPDEAQRDLTDYLNLFTLLKDERAVYERWYSLVRTYRVTGKNVHDARLVAAMERHAISHLLSLDVADFSRYAGVTVLTPTTLLSTSG